MTASVEIIAEIDRLDPAAWDSLVPRNYPFLKHAFLSAMENRGCLGEWSGWVPRHLACFEDGLLVGAMPLYEKHNSWGEFVFDHAWADAWQRAGLAYYPKLVNAVPFTPATGPRVLAHADQREAVSNRLLDEARQLMEKEGHSGLHCLFPDEQHYRWFNRDDAVTRTDCQFHWFNQDYRDFDGFLGTLKSKKRKNIRRERQRVADTGLSFRRLDGHTATAADWTAFTSLYRGIYERKYGYPVFNRAFFMDVAAAMPEAIVLVLAEHSGQVVAGALMYVDDDTLYGRHWGTHLKVDGLHFETCYYQGIEICIERGLARFDPGAQGEHKIARGFEPTRTRSLHWMAPGPFSQAIRQFAGQETTGIDRYMDAAHRHSAYHTGESG